MALGDTALPVFQYVRESHLSYADALSGLLGRGATGTVATAKMAAGWDDFVWRFIGEEVGVPTPVGTRHHVVRLLTEAGR